MAREPKNSIEAPPMQDAKITVNEADQATDNAAYTRSRCGGALRLAREAQSLSIQDVASKLRLGPKQIEAIEADHFAKLPEPTIVRGFIRNYAKLLKINAEPLLDAYLVLVPSSTQHALTVKPTTKMQVTSGDKPKPSSYVWAVLTVLLALGIWLFYQNFIQKPSPTLPSPGVESLNSESLESLPEPALPAAERAPESQPSIELTLPPATDIAPSSSSVDATAVSADITTPAAEVPNPTPPVAAPVVSSPTATIPAPVPTLAGMTKLEFNATQETWVSVIDASGRQIYSKTIFAGSRESIDVTPPVNVTVGNAGATSLNMNGKAINLAPHSRNNVAHIKLE